MKSKKAYTAPKLTRYDSIQDLPADLQEVAEELQEDGDRDPVLPSAVCAERE